MAKYVGIVDSVYSLSSPASIRLGVLRLLGPTGPSGLGRKLGTRGHVPSAYSIIGRKKLHPNYIRIIQTPMACD